MRVALYKAATVPQAAGTGSDLKSWLGDARASNMKSQDDRLLLAGVPRMLRRP